MTQVGDQLLERELAGRCGMPPGCQYRACTVIDVQALDRRVFVTQNLARHNPLHVALRDREQPERVGVRLPAERVVVADCLFKYPRLPQVGGEGSPLVDGRRDRDANLLLQRRRLWVVSVDLPGRTVVPARREGADG